MNIEPTNPLSIFKGGGASPTAEERGRLDAMLDILDSTEHGHEVAAYVRAHPEQIRIWDDAAYRAEFPGSGASFNVLRQQMNLPRSTLTHPARYATTLVHEGQHAVDAKSRLGVLFGKAFASIGGSAWDGVRAGMRLDNPMSGMLDGIATRQLYTEVNAYRTQAQVAKELGRSEYGWNLGQEIDGSVRSDEQIQQALDMEALYAMGAGRRLFMGASVGALGVLSSSMAINEIARRAAPSSYLAAHRWPVLAVGGALLGASILHDQIDYRRKLASGTLN